MIYSPRVQAGMTFKLLPVSHIISWSAFFFVSSQPLLTDLSGRRSSVSSGGGDDRRAWRPQCQHSAGASRQTILQAHFIKCLGVFKEIIPCHRGFKNHQQYVIIMFMLHGCIELTTFWFTCMLFTKLPYLSLLFILYPNCADTSVVQLKNKMQQQ